MLDNFPRSQHRPSLVHVGLILADIRCTGKKANWDKFSASTEKSIPIVPQYGIPVDEAYSRFTIAMSKATHSIFPSADSTMHEQRSPGVTG